MEILATPSPSLEEFRNMIFIVFGGATIPKYAKMGALEALEAATSLAGATSRIRNYAYLVMDQDVPDHEKSLFLRIQNAIYLTDSLMQSRRLTWAEDDKGHMYRAINEVEEFFKGAVELFDANSESGKLDTAVNLLERAVHHFRDLQQTLLQATAELSDLGMKQLRDRLTTMDAVMRGIEYDIKGGHPATKAPVASGYGREWPSAASTASEFHVSASTREHRLEELSKRLQSSIRTFLQRFSHDPVCFPFVIVSEDTTRSNTMGQIILDTGARDNWISSNLVGRAGLQPQATENAHSYIGAGGARFSPLGEVKITWYSQNQALTRECVFLVLDQLPVDASVGSSYVLDDLPQFLNPVLPSRIDLTDSEFQDVRAEAHARGEANETVIRLQKQQDAPERERKRRWKAASRAGTPSVRSIYGGGSSAPSTPADISRRSIASVLSSHDPGVQVARQEATRQNSQQVVSTDLGSLNTESPAHAPSRDDLS
ncbi:hypothetical protein PG993_006162 [Apiospora rasikravindrae]|uniref:Peptidase A2 domain-containing protein n=1 Tax=Apiospora rasikravindrae TaxID=990691 RepID=A0ABR1T4Y0_9PEZI